MSPQAKVRTASSFRRPGVTPMSPWRLEPTGILRPRRLPVTVREGPLGRRVGWAQPETSGQIIDGRTRGAGVTTTSPATD